MILRIVLWLPRWRFRCLASSIEREHRFGSYPPESIGATWLSFAAKLRAL